jgi:hypothetical protein
MKITMAKSSVLIPILLFIMRINPVQAVVCPSMADVFIDQYAPDENMNYRTRILISYHPSKGIARGLFKFDIPEEIDAAEVTAATLYLSGSYHTGGGDAISVNCYALNESFSEGSDTWNSLSGGDYDPSIASSGNLPSGNDWDTSIDVTELVAAKLDKLRNHGMLMRLQNENGDSYQNIASREFVDPQDFLPYLDIEYSESSSSSTTTEPAETSTTSMPVTSTTSSIITTSSTTTTVIEITTSIITSSTTTISLPCCFIETIYGEDSEQVLILKYIRDTMLQRTTEGREIINLYYTWSPFIVRLIETDHALRDEIKIAIDEFMDVIDEARY